METKLTLRLNKRVIDRAKNYAHNNNISLSKVVESYLESITKPKTSATEISPLVESLSGVIILDETLDHKKDYSKYLAEKYK
jgi:hypothetical protein